eukprot:3667962-Heterocapsa_arctica.AAC.1
MFAIPPCAAKVKVGDELHEDAFGFDCEVPSQVPLEGVKFEFGGRRGVVISCPGVGYFVFL